LLRWGSLEEKAGMLNWYVMRSKPNKEELLLGQLANRQIETYYPCIRVKPVNPRAQKIKPYFPGYMFIRTNLEIVGASNLQWLPGAMGLVNFDSYPATIDEKLLHAIRQKVEEVSFTIGHAADSFKPGDLVSIRTGPFAGYRAIFDSRLTGEERVRVLLQLLQDRQLSLEISAAHIERIQPPAYMPAD
jgi:transcriptional antiterminator RfaH